MFFRKLICKQFYWLALFFYKSFVFLLCLVAKYLFIKCGSNVVFNPINSVFSYSTIEIGDSVFIGGYAWFSCAFGVIHIGSNIMFGPGVSILGGNHRFSTVGLLMADNTHKVMGDDPGVFIGNDVWIGANTTILSGVNIGEGSIVGAGSVVTKSIPPYSIAAGNPAEVIRPRFSQADLIKHKEIISTRNI